MHKLFSLFLLAALPHAASASTPLGPEQIRKLIAGNSVTLQHNVTKHAYTIHYAIDGSATSRNENTGRISKGTWRITDAGEWCNHWPGSDERCGPMIDNGDGTYTRMESGKARAVWKKIHAGNALQP